MSDVMTFDASVELEAAGSKQRAPRVRVLAYSGGPMRVSMFRSPVIINLAGLNIPDQFPLLADHENNLSAIVGHGAAAVDGGQLLVEGGLLPGDPGRQVTDIAAAGVALKASVGVDVGQRRNLRAGESVEVNGRNFEAGSDGLIVVDSGHLREVSIVAIGADPNTSVSIAARRQGTTMVDDNNNGAGDGQGGNITAQHVSNVRDAEAKEMERIGKIRAACEGHETIAATAIREDWSVEKAELEVLKASRPNLTRFSNRPGENMANDSDVMTAALCLTAGIDEKIVGDDYGEKTMNVAASRDWRNFSIHGLLHRVIAAAGGHVGPGAKVNSDTIRAAFEADNILRASGGFSTVSLPGILSNVQNKAMLESYNAVATTWQLIANTTDVKDFKPWRRFRLTGKGEFTEVGADGELKHVGLTEQDYEGQLATHGALLQLTRQMIINDDAGALVEIPRILGRMSALRVEGNVYELLLSNPSNFFHADNNNLITDELDIDGLTEGEEVFLSQTDDNGKPILVNPRVLLTPTSLRTQAFQLVNSTELNETTTADTPAPRGNPHHQRFSPVASPWLNAQGISGSSDTAWYLFANPNAGVSAITVGFLDGRAVPTIESGESSFETLGMRWRAFHDFGVAMGDPRAAVKSSGAGS